MPVENELKFVLNLEAEHFFKPRALRMHRIKQGYLSFSDSVFLQSTRIRSKNTLSPGLGWDKFEFTFTYKQEVYKEIIEIEKTIEKEDFDKLWSLDKFRCFNKLIKTRFDCYFDSFLWEIDAFQDETGETYFLMAEHEMPAGQEKPLNIPSIIFDNLVFQVPREDARFSSKNLAEIDPAKQLYSELIGKKK